MADDTREIVIPNAWSTLRRLTPARIGLGRAGMSLPTAPHLEFQLAHARARRAVHHALDVAHTVGQIGGLGLACHAASSAAGSRAEYLQRPDKGRRLAPSSREHLAKLRTAGQTADVAVVVCDGLSALAIEENAVPFLATLLPALKGAGRTLAPAVVVEQGRVAVGDEVGELLGARLVVVLIGERPGLSSPDSMGLYLTLAPRVGLTDEKRNCISNVRREGLSYEAAAHKLVYLVGEALQRGYSGVELKDEAETLASVGEAPRTNFLLAGS